jgi:hypothetical protein
VRGDVGGFKGYSGLTLRSTPKSIKDTLEGMQDTRQGIYKVIHKLSTPCG